MSGIGKLLFKISRTNFGANIIGYCFQYISWAMPVSRTSVDQFCIAFHHPRPISDPHILVVPKQKIRDLGQLCKSANKSWRDSVIRFLEKEYNQQDLSHKRGCYFVVNGKSYQDVMQVHFHCMSYSQGSEHNFESVPSIDVFLQRMDRILDENRGVVIKDETMGSLLSNPKLQMIVDQFFQDASIKGFSMFSVVGSDLAQQRSGFRWSRCT